MTNREKLIELKRQAINYAQERADDRNGLVCIDDEVDYLLANRVTVLPCNVGDKIYTFGMFTGQIIESVVTSIIYSDNNVFLHLENETVVDVSQQLGKTVFLTKDELKAVFKEKIIEQ